MGVRVKPKKRCALCGHLNHHQIHTADHDFVKADEWAARKKAQEPRGCEMAGHSPCGRGQMGELTWHHIQGRGMGSTSHDDSPLARLCVKHHRWVESHRAEARELGFLLRRGP